VAFGFRVAAALLRPVAADQLSKHNLDRRDSNYYITGRGFGTHSPYNGDSAYIRLSDPTKDWNAGWTLDPGTDLVSLVVNSWTGQLDTFSS
jgi:hypothetical protein